MSSKEQATPCMIIGEIAQAHDGSLGLAHAYIDAVANAGADAIKFQTHIAAAESSKLEPWRVRFSPQDETRFDYWKRTEFTEEQWWGLKKHADQRGLLFFSSPFSLEAAEMLLHVGVAGWKIASGEFNNIQLLDFMLKTGQPILLSTGMSSYSEIDAAVARIRAHGNRLTVFQCTSAYPCPPEKVGLNVIPELRERYRCQVGLSDHSGSIFPGLAAVALGLDALEVHVTLSREMFGPDVPASITTQELRELVKGVRLIERMKASIVDKDEVAAQMIAMRSMFSKSIVAARDIVAGEILCETDLCLRKPGTGLPPNRLPEVIGRRLAKAVAAGEQISNESLSEIPETAKAAS